MSWWTLLVTLLTLPGLLSVQALPNWATPAAAAVAPPDTPDQLTGSAAGLPPLVGTAETVTSAKPGIPAREAEKPEGAVPLEDRFTASTRPDLDVDAGKRELPQGVQRAESADRAAAVALAPFIDDQHPDHQALSGSLTPLLTVQVTSLGGGTAGSFRFFFHVCEKPEEDEEETDPGAPPPVPLCVESGRLDGVSSWRVPAGKLEWGKQYEWWVRVNDPASGTQTITDKRLFTTGVHQPATTSTLGERGANGQEFYQASGNYTTQFTDASVATAGPPLSVVRTYNSLDPRTDGIFGAGWSTRWDMKIVAENRPSEAETLLVTYPDGRQVRFAADGDGQFQPPPGMHATLAEVEPGGWKLMDKSSTTYLFDAQGRLLEVVDSRARAQTLHYGSDGKLTKVSAAGGRSLHFTWTGAQVASVSTDAVDGQPLTWTYRYTAGNLTSVCAPVAAPNCTGFEYGDGSRYRNLVLDAEPVGYFRLGDKEFEHAANEGTHGGPGVYHQVTTGQAGVLQGTTDTAVEFTRSTMQLPSFMLSRRQNQGSVETWFKTSVNGVILSASRSGYPLGAPYAMIYVGTDGRLRGRLGAVDRVGNAIPPITTTGRVDDGQWHHVVLNVSGQQQKLYLDGQAVGELTAEASLEYLMTAYVGSGDRANGWDTDTPGGPAVRGAFPFQGTIDEFAVYGKPLTEAEIGTHYAARAKVANKLAKITLPSGKVWAANTYNPVNDRIATHTDQHGGTWKIGETGYAYDTGFARVEVTDPKGGTLIYDHDAWRGYRLAKVTDPRGGVSAITTYDFDRRGFVKKITDPNGNITRQSNDRRGNLLSRTTCRSANNCQTSYYSYHVNEDDHFDARNDRLITSRDGRSAGKEDDTYAATTEYTVHGDVARQRTPATPDFPNGRTVTYTYTDGTEPAVGGGTTPAGLLESEKDAKNNETTYRYTAAGDLAEKTSPAGLVMKYTYDAIGRLVGETQISDAHPDGVTTTVTYDGMSRILTRTSPGVRNEVSDVTHTARTSYTYDADGNVLTETLSDLTGGDPESKTIYEYDDHGRVKKTTGPEGAVISTTWDNIGAQVATTDEMGTQFTYAYTERGQFQSTTIKNWTGSPVNPQAPRDAVLESYSYDPGGRLATQADAMGRKTSYKYFNDNLLSQVIADDALLNGSTTARDVVLTDNTYDAAGQLTKTVTGGNKAVTAEYVYDAAGLLTSDTFDPASTPAPLRRKTAYAYDAVGNVTKETFTGSATTRQEVVEYDHNTLNQVTRQTVDNGDTDLVTTWAYDDRGLLVQETSPRGNQADAGAADFTTTSRYDVFGRLVEVKEPQVTVEKAGTASTTRPTTRYGYDSFGLRTHVVDPEGRATTSLYDKAGRPLSDTGTPYTPPGGTAVTPKISYAYDAAGRTTKITDPRGFVTTNEYDALGNLVRVTDPGPSGPGGQWMAEYDLLGEQLAVIDPTGARAEATYDDLGRAVTRTQIERKPTTAVYTTRYTYDDAGNLTHKVVPGTGNRTTIYGVNAAGEVTTVTDPLNRVSAIAYDNLGRTTKVTDPLGNATVAEYDIAGRQVTAKDLNKSGATLRTFGFGFDADGNPTATTSAEGHVTRREFDALGQLTKLIEPVSAAKSITTTFGYDATGAQTRLTDGRGNATWTTYNTLGLAETLTEPATTAHPAAADRTWTNLYDIAGNNIATLQPGGVRIDREYDHLGRLTKQTGSGAQVATPVRTYGYDTAGRNTSVGDYGLEYNDRSLLTKVAKPTGPSTTYAYDALGNPTQRVDAAGTADFTWDNADRLRTAGDPVTGRTSTYAYDDADRLTSLTSAGPATTQSYTYDAMNRPETHTLKNGTGAELAKITYGWDKDDNLTSKATSGTAGAGNNTYGYDQAGRLTSWTDPDGRTTDYAWDDSGNRIKAGEDTFTYDERNRLLSGGGTDYTYTPRGTLATETKDGTTRNLVFDAFDRLITDGETTYGYDAFGRMTGRAKAGSQQSFVYSGLDNDIAAVLDASGTVQAKYSRDPFGGLLGLQEGGTAAAGTMTDAHGDLVATFSGTALVDSTAYSPFGEVVARTGTARSLGFQGEYTDPGTGKVNMNARWYQPGTGGFASRDDWTLPPSPSVQANRYTYGNANPLGYIDPSGHAATRPRPGLPGSECVTATAVGGVVGGAGCFIVAFPQSTAPRHKDVAMGACRWIDPRPQCNRPVAQPNACAEFANKCPNKGGGGSPPKSSPPKSNPRKPTPVPPKANPPIRRPSPCTSCGNPVRGPGTKANPKPTIYPHTGTNFDPSAPWFKNHPDNVTVDRNPPPAKTPYTCVRGMGCPDDYAGTTEWIEFNGDIGTNSSGGGNLCDPGTIYSTIPGACPNAGGGAGSDIKPQGEDHDSSDGFELPPIIPILPIITAPLAPVVLAPVVLAPGVLAPLAPRAPLGPRPPTDCLPGNSFVAGTEVLLADGTKKPIEEVKIGDKVLATNSETGETVAEDVTALIVGEGAKSLVAITVDVDGERGTSTASIIATDGHPFWLPHLRVWLDAGELQPGMWLRTSVGTYVQITAVKKWNAPERVYNLTVDRLHTYYVLAGGTPVLVHNSGCGPDLGETWKPKTAAQVCGTGGCEKVADHIQSVIGGDIMRLTDRYGAPQLGKYRGVDSGWNYHDVVVKDGRVFDATTGRYGESMANYRANWEYGDDLVFSPAPR
ncbi:polymorphic toxin-type HINT domain-containing protein [Microtetraspora sp. NBRC 13810]|uniref:polymorphic toxin-type HINT domain-containing protein n=1 Tax=Microtetraspora sp. NBRC 13810 TaxID=3030990 RepID=UPI0025573875|nr:polymorphic toxin-type HINT domain-containing protein [Microtetraspora sp. NBRC 13810]